MEDGGGLGVGGLGVGVGGVNRRGARSASAWCRDRCTAGGALKDRRGRIGGDEASVTGSASTSSPSPDPNGFVDVRGVLTRPSSTRGALSSQVQPIKE